MKKLLGRRPSASMVVAMLALVVALTGTAYAAGLVNGDKLIKKNSLSGNRLRNHTITGTQVNLNQLGKVPSAKNADVAKSLPALTWTNLTLLNGWAKYGSSSFGVPGLQYTKDAEGFVHLRGTLSGTAKTSSTVATLPTGVRPPSGAWASLGNSNGAFNPFPVNTFIDSAGNINVENGTGANDRFVSFEGVEFYVG
jgi:hypothetical protein